ncbi:MAG: arginase family protein [Symbiobacterium sp.]|uniref:arginase family protein n=1 Tax=Symbiobacterium sp. TaxID=1971213 RepID=UPI003463ECA2
MSRPFLVLNLDDTLTWQSRLLASPHEWVDLRHLTGKKSCATPEALSAIAAALEPHRDVPLGYWGTGEYHYVTLLRLQSLRQPVSLVLFDHHHDASPVQGGVVTCGDWVRHALALPWVRRVVWVGGREPELQRYLPHPRILRVPEPAPPARFAEWADRTLPGSDIYISVDKDVLAPDDAVTTWGAGDLPLADLLSWLHLLGRHRRIVGADVCGEWEISPTQVVPSLQDRAAIRRNEQANIAIRDALAPVLHGSRLTGVGRTD